MKTLREIQAEIEKFASVIGASRNDLPTYGCTRDFAYPYIEVDTTHYHYVVVERGQEISRQTTRDFEDLLFWVFADATHNLAFTFELAHRVEDQDCRRTAFPKQIELLNLINPKMGARRAEEIAEILRNAPYDDEPIKALNRRRLNCAT